MPEDVLDHDDRGIDDQAEIDGADRQQIRRLAAQHHEPDRERQGERDGQATITALRRLPRKAHCSRKISTMPAIMLCSTVRVVTWIRSLRS